MSAFLEHSGVDPTDNASERAPRYMVAFQKMMGQEGRPPAMGRLGYIATRALTWGRRGKSAYEEVSRLIYGPCEFIRSFGQ